MLSDVSPYQLAGQDESLWVTHRLQRLAAEATPNPKAMKFVLDGGHVLGSGTKTAGGSCVWLTVPDTSLDWFMDKPTGKPYKCWLKHVKPRLSKVVDFPMNQ